MKYFFIGIIIFINSSNSIFASEIDFLGIKLFDTVDKFERINEIKLDNPKKCKENHCTYFFKYKLDKDKVKYFTNYYLATNDNYEIINIKAILFNRDSLKVPENFINNCKTQHLSWSKDYLIQKYKMNKNKFINSYSKGKSTNTAEYENILFHQSKLYLDSDKKIFEIYCKYSRSDNNKWIISYAGTKLMTKDYHDKFETNFPKKKISKFEKKQIKSYLFPSSF